VLKPRVNGHTLLLWLTPPAGVSGGGFALCLRPAEGKAGQWREWILGRR